MKKDVFRGRCEECGRKLTEMMEFELNTLTCWCGEPFGQSIWFREIIRAAIKNADNVEIGTREVSITLKS